MINLFKKKENKKQGEKIRAHVFVSGKVQGVFFRENIKKKAEKLAVLGWAKNLKDGRLEAVFEGDRQKVEKMVNWMKRGPIWAKVEGLDVIWEDYQDEFKGFEIRYDLL